MPSLIEEKIFQLHSINVTLRYSSMRWKILVVMEKYLASKMVYDMCH